MQFELVDNLLRQIDRVRDLRTKILEIQSKFISQPATAQRSFKPCTAIIVEPRKHRALSFVVRNVLENLEQNWNVQIFHGTLNKTFVEELLDGELSFLRSRITLKNLGVENLSGIDEYSRLLTSREFIEQIPSEMFLIFQTDSMINPEQKERIHEFMEYDYVGAPWSHGLVGNGGFSLRRRSKMLELLHASPPYIGGNEDTFFSFHAKRLKFNVPSAEKAKEFAVETMLSENFFGLHRVWSYHADNLLQLCIRCPGLNDLISLQDVVDDGNMNTAIIVEPRKHRALSFVVQNVLENLPDNWNVRIFHGTLNKTFVEELLDGELSFLRSRITLKNLGVDNLPGPIPYSNLLASREFTENIPTETFIVFQTDSMINPNHRDLLDNFLKYDYVGAPWPWEHLMVGNGGFSLRKRSKMLRILNTLPPFSGAYEDQFFSCGSKIAQLYKPTREEAMEFSIEQVYSPRSFAIHNAWKYLPEMVEQMCKDCPGLETLISLQETVD